MSAGSCWSSKPDQNVQDPSMNHSNSPFSIGKMSHCGRSWTGTTML
uniref:Uncharacterized protein n=1 Tax=Anguilla anguilla TaxID=7936 RepID=A0A0E9V7Z0_ANGAN